MQKMQTHSFWRKELPKVFMFMILAGVVIYFTPDVLWMLLRAAKFGLQFLIGVVFTGFYIGITLWQEISYGG